MDNIQEMINSKFWRFRQWNDIRDLNMGLPDGFVITAHSYGASSNGYWDHFSLRWNGDELANGQVWLNKHYRISNQILQKHLNRDWTDQDDLGWIVTEYVTSKKEHVDKLMASFRSAFHAEIEKERQEERIKQQDREARAKRWAEELDAKLDAFFGND